MTWKTCWMSYLFLFVLNLYFNDRNGKAFSRKARLIVLFESPRIFLAFFFSQVTETNVNQWSLEWVIMSHWFHSVLQTLDYKVKRRCHFKCTRVLIPVWDLIWVWVSLSCVVAFVARPSVLPSVPMGWVPTITNNTLVKATVLPTLSFGFDHCYSEDDFKCEFNLFWSLISWVWVLILNLLSLSSWFLRERKTTNINKK